MHTFVLSLFCGYFLTLVLVKRTALRRHKLLVAALGHNHAEHDGRSGAEGEPRQSAGDALDVWTLSTKTLTR
jgi:hypothetical protein